MADCQQQIDPPAGIRGYSGPPCWLAVRRDPGDPAGLKLPDDRGGGFVVKARPVGPGTGMRRASGHPGPPRRAPKDSLPALNPSRNPAQPSPSQTAKAAGSCAAERRRPFCGSRFLHGLYLFDFIAYIHLFINI
jgi:hypothetical protein